MDAARPSLESLAAERRQITDALARKMAELKAAVLAELAAPGAEEAAVARRAGVARMTVREWSGKRVRVKKAAR